VGDVATLRARHRNPLDSPKIFAKTAPTAAKHHGKDANVGLPLVYQGSCRVALKVKATLYAPSLGHPW